MDSNSYLKIRRTAGSLDEAYRAVSFGDMTTAVAEAGKTLFYAGEIAAFDKKQAEAFRREALGILARIANKAEMLAVSAATGVRLNGGGHGYLHDYNTAGRLRKATKAEAAASVAASKHDGGAGVIVCTVKGKKRHVYVA